MVADPRRLAVHIDDKLAHIMMLCCCDGFGEHGAVATPFCRRPRILRLRKGFALFVGQRITTIMGGT
jgi:hypothetical protein